MLPVLGLASEGQDPTTFSAVAPSMTATPVAALTVPCASSLKPQPMARCGTPCQSACSSHLAVPVVAVHSFHAAAKVPALAQPQHRGVLRCTAGPGLEAAGSQALQPAPPLGMQPGPVLLGQLLAARLGCQIRCLDQVPGKRGAHALVTSRFVSPLLFSLFGSCGTRPGAVQEREPCSVAAHPDVRETARRLAVKITARGQPWA